MGITFKEDCPDIRNSKVIDIIKELKEYEIDVKVYDPIAEAQEVYHHYGIKLSNLEEIKEMDAVIFAVSHSDFRNLTMEQVESLFANRNNVLEEVATDVVEQKSKERVLIFVKGIFNKQEAIRNGYKYWRL